MTEREAIDLFRTNFDHIGEVLTGHMVSEIESQGHRATGKLIESIDRQTQKVLDGIDTAISYLDYGGIVNSGVRANRIPFGGNRGGGGTSKFITALMEWVRFKGIAGGLDKNIKSATFAIAKKMKKEGSPTKGSFQFSQNGRRMKWLDFTVQSNRNYIDSEVKEVSNEYIDNLFYAKLDEITKAWQQ